MLPNVSPQLWQEEREAAGGWRAAVEKLTGQAPTKACVVGGSRLPCTHQGPPYRHPSQHPAKACMAPAPGADLTLIATWLEGQSAVTTPPSMSSAHTSQPKGEGEPRILSRNEIEIPKTATGASSKGPERTVLRKVPLERALPPRETWRCARAGTALGFCSQGAATGATR